MYLAGWSVSHEVGSGTPVIWREGSLPSPTRNCHSGPVGFEMVLFVSIMGTMPVRPAAP
jgi:hypothetical protein